MINWGIEQLGIPLGSNLLLFPKKVASGHTNSSPSKFPSPGPLVTAHFPLIDDTNIKGVTGYQFTLKNINGDYLSIKNKVSMC